MSEISTQTPIERKFKQFDLVKCTKQPRDMWGGDILGFRGFIAHLEGNGRVDFHALKLTNQAPGQGNIPEDCLELYTDSELEDAYEEARLTYDKYADDLEKKNPDKKINAFRLPQRRPNIRQLRL